MSVMNKAYRSKETGSIRKWTIQPGMLVTAEHQYEMPSCAPWTKAHNAGLSVYIRIKEGLEKIGPFSMG